MFQNIVYKFTKVDNLSCGRVTIRKILPGRLEVNKHCFLCFHWLSTNGKNHWQQENKLLQPLYYTEMGFWGKNNSK